METPITFDCKGQQLVGMMHLPEGRAKCPAVLMLHGFTADKTEAHRMFVKLGRALCAQGIVSLRFDFRGSGDSEGEFENMTLRSELADAQEALRVLVKHKRVNNRRIAVVGMSMGAMIASMLVARERDRIKSMALWAPVAEGEAILNQLSTPDAVTSLAQTGVTDYEGYMVGMPFIRQFAEAKPLRDVVKAKCPVLIAHGEKDQTVPVQHATLYEEALQSPKRQVRKLIIPGADHAFSRHAWETRLILETITWLAETL
jgi:dipeptidyl aminopeptidase/acylaminoacyl peptidase